MHIAGIFVACLLIGQATGGPSNRVQPPEMIAQAMQLPTGSAISGQPLTLVSALSSTMDRRQQLDITRTYWRLAQAIAEYHYCLDHVRTLDSAASHGETASLRLARAAATATVRQAELEATSAQCDLAAAIHLPAGSALPLPADRPHVGAYRTNFQELFAGRTAPEPLARVDRVLPIRRQAIDEQAAAVRAAEDVLLAAGSNADTVAQYSGELLKQQRTLVRWVGDYNRNIAEYGLAVAGPLTSPQSLVAMLIGPAPTSTSNPPDAKQASTNEPVTRPQQTAEPNELRTGWRTGQPTPAIPQNARPLKNEPTLAPPRDDNRRVDINEPIFAPKDEGVKTVGAEEPAPTQFQLQPAGTNEPTLAPPRENQSPASIREPVFTLQKNDLRPSGTTKPAPATPSEKSEPTRTPPRKNKKTFNEPTDVIDQPMVPIESPKAAPAQTPSQPTSRTTNKPATADDGTGIAATPLYPALIGASPAVQAKQLAIALNWDRTLPQGIGKPMNLQECVMRDPGTNRHATIASYWQLRRQTAEYQTFAQQLEWLDALVPLALDHRSQPSGANDMLQLRAAQVATRAAQREAHAALIEAQYDFALHVGMAADQVWPLASTIPHAGSYLLNIEAQPRALAESWPVRRLTATLPAMGQRVQASSSAVVEADAARVAAAEQYRAGSASIDRAVESILNQTQQTLAVLSALTDYNQAIADYVLTVMPPTTSPAQLVAAMVVKP